MKTFSKKPVEKNLLYTDCPVCGSSTRKMKWDLGVFAFYKCSDCGLVYQHPQPVQEELADRYDDEYFEYEIENEAVFLSLMLKSLEDVDFKRASGFLMDSPSFLDVGCATGILLEWMRNEGWDVRGVEICAASASYGQEKRGIDIVNSTFEKASFPAESFSVVHSSHFIEHLTRPDLYFKEAFKVLRPGGLLITSTPNVWSFQALLYGQNWRSAIADHMCLFSLKTLKRALLSSGFEPVSWKTWGGLPAGSVSPGIKKIADKVCKSTGIGDVMVVLAVKPED